MSARVADDLFAGAGGWDLGAREVGLEARGVELAPYARATRDAAGLVTIHDDVWTFAPAGDAEVQIASPPCPTFSLAGGGSGRRSLDAVLALIPAVPDLALDELRARAEALDDDPRTALVLAPLWFAIHGGYRRLAWEQVKECLPIWRAAGRLLTRHGFHVWTDNLHAEQYGVPQTRTRAILIASRDHRPGQPPPTHSRFYSHDPARLDRGVAPWLSISDVLPEIPAGGELCPTNPRPNAARRPPHHPAPTMAFGHETPRWILDARRINNQSGTAYDLAEQVNSPATTVAGRDIVGFRGANANRFNDSSKSRNDGIRVTVAEAGLLQTFPLDHPWRGNQGEQYLQAGNAVPPLLARHVLAEALGHNPREADLFDVLEGAL